jgi:hypothetical protein
VTPGTPTSAFLQSFNATSGSSRLVAMSCQTEHRIARGRIDSEFRILQLGDENFSTL